VTKTLAVVLIDISKFRKQIVDIQKNRQIFFPIAYKAAEESKRFGNRFAYYTTAEVAYAVIKDMRMWMRSTTTMNDFLELQYGRNLLRNAMEGAAGAALKGAVEKSHPGLFEETWSLAIAWMPGFIADTFITCVSRHLPEEDDLGRLSMWRAYGGKTGVALIFNGGVFDLQTDALGAYSSPVSYFDQMQFSEAVSIVAENISQGHEYVSSLPRETVKNLLFTVFRFAILCTKHPGFAEEQEWRIVASPTLQKSELLESAIAVVRGVPQPILKIPLQNFPNHQIAGLSVPELINRVIIGPCDFPQVTYRALWTALSDSGVESPEGIIVRSEIPLRHT
jgi:hypothetical protein